MYTETQASRVVAPLRKNLTILYVCPSGSTTVLYDGGACVLCPPLKSYGLPEPPTSVRKNLIAYWIT